MTRIILQSTMSCSTFGLYVAYLNHMKRRRWITGDATLAGILTPDLRSSVSNASFFVGFITNEFRILERLTFILQGPSKVSPESILPLKFHFTARITLH